MIRHSVPLLLAVVVAAMIAGCSSQKAAAPSAASGTMAARDQLNAELRQCTGRYGYDPEHVTGVAENALAPQELQWRQCAYDAVRAYERSNPALTSRYEQLISEDIQMTTAIQQGTMTRSQRRARVQDLVAQIKSAEEAQATATAAENDRQAQQVREVVENFRGFGY